MPLLYILLSIVILVLLYLAWEIIRKRKSTEESEIYRHLKSDYDVLLNSKNLLEGKYTELEKQNYERKCQLDDRVKNIQKLESQIAVYNKTKELNEQEYNRRIQNSENARKSFEDEKIRIAESDRLKKQQEAEERTRIWAMHEEASKSKMSEICKKSGLALSFYDNNNLPEGFDPKLKPDFMVKLLNQYVIFDSKISTAQSISTYLSGQVKSTALKIKKSESCQDIYNTVFFVIPGLALSDLKETYYIEEGISFFIIPLEAFEPIVRTLKRLEEYDLTDKYDPQDREKIVNTIAALDSHIRYQNTTNILTTLQGIKILEESNNMPEDMIKDVESRRNKMRVSRLPDNEIKRLITSPDSQLNEIKKMVSPRKSEINDKDLFSTGKED